MHESAEEAALDAELRFFGGADVGNTEGLDHGTILSLPRSTRSVPAPGTDLAPGRVSRIAHSGATTRGLRTMRRPRPGWCAAGDEVRTMQDIRDVAAQRILVLDGAYGTALQQANLTEADFRFDGDDPARSYAGNFDLIQLTRPDVLGRIHEEYLTAGADILKTNTFNAQAISQADYATERLVRQMNLAGARLARAAADRAQAADGRPRWVAGSVGPTNRTASLSPDVERPGFRAITYDGLVAAYLEQITALLDGSVDLLLVETVFDTLNAKAALEACEQAFDAAGRRVPIMLSGTITDASGRTLSGQTPEAFVVSTEHADLFSVGLNCALGPEPMHPYLREIAETRGALVSTHPNAGLPNAFGEYDESPEQMAPVVDDFAREGLLNVVGGCCGTSPDHIAAFVEPVSDVPPRGPHPTRTDCVLGSGAYAFTPQVGFINVGERTNLTGSPRFRRAVLDGDVAAAVASGAQQVESGAKLIDVNVDDGMIDGQATVWPGSSICSRPIRTSPGFR